MLGHIGNLKNMLGIQWEHNRNNKNLTPSPTLKEKKFRPLVHGAPFPWL